MSFTCHIVYARYELRFELVSFRKRLFCEISVSIYEFACATYSSTSPHNSLISLTFRKIVGFRIGNNLFQHPPSLRLTGWERTGKNIRKTGMKQRLSDKDSLHYSLTRLLALQEKDAATILNSIYPDSMYGVVEQVTLARIIKAETLGLSFIVLKRWHNQGRLQDKLAVPLEEAQEKLIDLAQAISSAEWWIRHRDDVNLLEVIQGKKVINDHPGNSKMDPKLVDYFR